MLNIADALGDAETYLAEYCDHDPEALTVPVIAVRVAQRLTSAARHLETCGRLARGIDRWGELADHRSDVAQLRRDHGRQYGFWSLVPKAAEPAVDGETDRQARDGPVKASL
jgi:hypothetical protein